MSWWDYGYQITAMANRTILVDNNTWNNTHISRVGQVNSQSQINMVFHSLSILQQKCLPIYKATYLSDILSRFYFCSDFRPCHRQKIRRMK